MRIQLKLGCVLCIALALGIRSHAQTADRPAHCPPQSQERNFSEPINDKDIHLVWTSEWNQEGQVVYFYREVKNKGKRSFEFRWPKGGLGSAGLAPDSLVSRCTADFGYQRPEDGLLFYGRQDTSTPTKVWTSGSKPQSSAYYPEGLVQAHVLAISLNSTNQSSPQRARLPLCTPLVSTYSVHLAVPKRRRHIFFIPLPRQYELIDADLIFTSSCEAGDEGWILHQRVTNRSPNPEIALAWQSVFPRKHDSSSTDDISDVAVDELTGSFTDTQKAWTHYQSMSAPGLTSQDLGDFFGFLWRFIWPTQEEALDLPSPFDKGPTFSRDLTIASKPRLGYRGLSVSCSTGKVVFISSVPAWIE